MSTEIKLFTGPGAAGLAVHWMLLELDLPFELVLLDLDNGEQHLPAYRSVNPTGRVPALTVDGRVHLETTAILMWLAEMYPDKHLAPRPGSGGRAEYLQWMIYLANTLMPAFRAWFYADGGEDARATEEIRGAARRQIEACFDQLDGLFSDGREFFVGGVLSTADLLLTMLLRWSRKMPRPSGDWAFLNRYQQGMKQNPNLREAHRREGLTDWLDDA